METESNARGRSSETPDGHVCPLALSFLTPAREAGSARVPTPTRWARHGPGKPGAWPGQAARGHRLLTFRPFHSHVQLCSWGCQAKGTFSPRVHTYGILIPPLAGPLSMTVAESCFSVTPRLLCHRTQTLHVDWSWVSTATPLLDAAFPPPTCSSGLPCSLRQHPPRFCWPPPPAPPSLTPSINISLFILVLPRRGQHRDLAGKAAACSVHPHAHWFMVQLPAHVPGKAP